MFAEIVWDKQTLGVVMIFAIPLVAIIGGLWAKVEHHRAETELKRTMVQRGMSVDEIERVIAAKQSTKK